MKKETIIDFIFICLIGILSWNLYSLRVERQQLENSLDYYTDILENPIFQDPSLPSLSDSLLPDFQFAYLNREDTLLFAEINKKPHLLVVFTPNDCLACFSETDFWEQLATVFRDKVNVVGIISGESREKCTAFINREKINIPVAYDPSYRILENLHLKNTGLTPVKAFINTERKVLHVSRTTYDNAIAQIRYSRALQSLLSEPQQ